MTQSIAKLLDRLKKDESGTASVEFILVFPVFLSLMLMSIEIGYITLRHTMLERGLDIAVRQVRLGTGDPGNHAEIKEVICENAGFLLNCDNDLRLEMKPVDLRGYAAFETAAKCTDNSEPVDPAVLTHEFVFGGENDLMLLRACYKYKPFFPEGFLGKALTKDANGDAAIVTMTAFVQEPL